MNDPVVEKVGQFAQALLPSMGLELVDVQFRRESAGWVLRLFIDGPEGVTLDDCASVSRELSDYLDVEDLIEHAYHLEVSSPGLERPINKPEEFQRFVGKKAKVKLREEVAGQKVVVGEIVQAGEENVLIRTEDGQDLEIDFEKIRKARLSL